MGEFPPAEPPGYRPPTSAEELRDRYRSGERYFRGARLGGADFAAVFGAEGARPETPVDDPWRAAVARRLGGSRARPALMFADLSEADLRGATLRGLALGHTVFWKANFAGADLRGADLGACVLIAADFGPLIASAPHDVLGPAEPYRCADLSGARLRGAYLQGARLRTAVLEGADAADAHLQVADLRGANLRRASLDGANLAGADMTGTLLADATVGRAVLDGGPWRTNDGPDFVKPMLDELAARHGRRVAPAKVTRANFEGADLRQASGLRLDSTYVRNARFAPAARDPWSTLRRRYTGSMFVLNLLLLGAFLVPHLVDAVAWRVVEQVQGLEAVRRALSDLALGPCLAARCEEWPMWQLLLGVPGGVAYWSLGLSLLLYNLGRATLTVAVGLLRDEEERSGYAPSWLGPARADAARPATSHPGRLLARAPAWWPTVRGLIAARRGYAWLWQVHRWLMRPLVVVVAVNLLWHLWHWLFATRIFLPG